MLAEIISIGDEILIGQIVNTNATYLSKNLTALGVDVKWITVVGDDGEQILGAIETAVNRAQIILLTGGLGPTHDDITKKVICDYFNTKLVENSEALENVRRIFESLGRSLDSINSEQALVPEAATVLSNRIGTAPGLYFKKEHFHLFVLPGVPMEMKALFADHIASIIQNNNDRGFIAVSTIKSTGIFESKLFQLVSDLVEKFSPAVKVAFLPTPAGVNLRLMVAGNPPEAAISILENAKNQFTKRMGDYVYGFDDARMEQLLAQELISRNQSVAIADAFTGGILAARIRDLPHSGDFFHGSVVWPGVESREDIFVLAGEKFEFKTESPVLATRVSQKIRKIFQTDWGVSVFPESLSNEAPPKVTVGICGPAVETIETVLYRKVRTDNKERVAQFVLNALRKILIK